MATAKKRTRARNKINSIKPSVERFKQVIIEQRGNVNNIAKALGIAYTTVYKWANEDNLQSTFQTARELKLDELEAVAHERAISGKSDACLIFMLKTQGKSRGYVEKQEIDHTITPPTAVNIISVAANQIADDIDG